MWRYIGERRTFLFLVVLAFITYLPVLTLSTPYADDILRETTGVNHNLQTGRPLTELLAFMLFQGSIVNASPAPQVLAIVIYAAAASVLADRVLVAPWPVRVAAASLLLAGPVLTHNMMYRFDAPFMALALYLAVLAGAEQPDSEYGYSWMRVVVKGALLVASLSLYQPALGAFIAATAAMNFRYALAPSKPSGRASFAAENMTALIFAALIYGLLVFVLLRPMIAAGGYSSTHAELVSGPATVLANLSAFGSSLWRAWSGTLFGALVLLMATTGGVALTLRLIKNGASHGYILWVVASLAAVLVAPAAMQIPLKSPVILPRTLYGIGVSLAVLSWLIVPPSASKDTWRGYMMLGGAVVVHLYSMMFVATAMSASNEQREYEDRIIRSALSHLPHLPEPEDAPGLTVSGSPGFAYKTARAMEAYPVLYSIIIPALGADWLTRPWLIAERVKVVLTPSDENTRSEKLGSGLGWTLYAAEKGFWVELSQPL